MNNLWLSVGRTASQAFLPKVRAVFQTSLKKIAPKSKLMEHMAEILTLMLVSPGGVVTTELQTIDRPVRDAGEDVGDLHTASGSWRSRAFFICRPFLPFF